MRTGAFALFDALGYRGIWKRLDPNSTRDKMQRLWTVAEQARSDLLNGMKENGIHVDGHVAFFSDTIAVGAWALDEPDSTNAAACIACVAYVAASVAEAAIDGEPRLAYRGCITFGAFDFDKTFVIGEAVDEAAEHYERADAAVVWLTPKARRLFDRAVRENVIDHHPTGLMALVSVPMKGGGHFRTFVVNPLQECETEERRSAVQKGILACFGSEDLDVQIKKQNTRAVLREVEKAIELRDLRRRLAKSADERKRRAAQSPDTPPEKSE